MLVGWLIWLEVLLPRWLRKEALRLRKTNGQCALSNGVTSLHFSSRLSFFFCEYLIILAQLAKNRSGDWLFKNREVRYATYISKVSPPIAH